MTLLLKNYRSAYLMLILSQILLIFKPTDIHAVTELFFYNRYQYLDNLDFTGYDAATFIEQRANPDTNSDDTYQWGSSSFGLAHRVTLKKTEFYFQLFRSGFWGGDNLQSSLGNSLYFRELYIQANVKQHQITVGRQRIEIGGHSEDYFFSDIIDGIVFRLNDQKKNQYLLSTDILSNSINNQELGLYSFVAKDEEAIDDFRGDTISARIGGNFKFSLYNEASRELSFRTFIYGVRYAANTRGGADLARNGLLARNKSDGDSFLLGGMRISNRKIDGDKTSSIDFTLAHSNARDKKKEIEQGQLWHGWAGMIQFSQERAKLEQRFVIGVFGNGYVGFRGSPLGESILYGATLFTPSPYIGAYHFVGTGTNPLRIESSAKMFLKISEIIKFSQQSGNFTFNLLSLWNSQNASYLGSELTLQYQQWFEAVRFGIGLGVFWPAPSILHDSGSLVSATSIYLNLDFYYSDQKSQQKPQIDYFNGLID